MTTTGLTSGRKGLSMGKNCGNMSHSKLCQCDGDPAKVPPKPEHREVYVDWADTIVRFVNMGLSRHPDGKEKWYVYFSPPLRSKNRKRITRMGLGAWYHNAKNERKLLNCNKCANLKQCSPPEGLTGVCFFYREGRIK